jgi:P27 family predicted phage terminase small subunit
MPTPRKTDFMHELSGTKSQATTPDVITPPGRPRFPKNLSKESRAVFKRLCSLLESRRALTCGDGELLLLYAVSFERWQRALVHVQTEGEIVGYTKLDSNGAQFLSYRENLWLPVAEKAEKALVGIIDRLGLSPLNRSKVKPTGEVVKPKDIDPLDEILSRRARKAFIAPAYAEPETADTSTDFTA